MYLKAIRAYGFKSFADKLNIEFDKNITAIVGPNGSGKSNIVDAIRWVLGEQSVKSLRATDSMTDVIFSGSKTRDPLTRASVTLVFDNTSHDLNCEFEEVEIKRIVYKTGENEYYINNSKVRLKDITSLFLDTGAGNESFNIISQGSVASIVEAKPEMRRNVIESAAGVLKYKKRKEECLRKLEKVDDNINTVNLLINELAETMNPLEEQSRIASEYLDAKKNLESIEVALTALDIKNIKEKNQDIANEILIIKKELLELDTKNVSSGTKIEENKVNLLKLEEQIAKLNDEFLNVSSELSLKVSEKRIMLERQKYEISKEKIAENLVALKDECANVSTSISIKQKDKSDLDKSIMELSLNIENLKNEYLTMKVKKSNLGNDLIALNKKEANINAQISSLEYTINSNALVPNAIKSILNRNIPGIYDRIGNLIKCSDEYLLAIEVALGSASNFIICEDENAAKSGIYYLKSSNFGRATFFPLNVIKGRFIDNDSLKLISDDKEFVGVASKLVSFDKKYYNVIENQLGNVLIVKNIDALNRIGKMINYKYRIVSLDGEVLHSGGSITGGSYKNNDSVAYEKKRLQNLKEEKNKINQNISLVQNDIDDYDKNLLKFENELSDKNLELITFKQKFSLLEEELKNLVNKENELNSEINGMSGIDSNSLDNEVIKLVDVCNELEKQKSILENEIQNIKDKRSLLNDEINKEELEDKQFRNAFNEKQRKVYELENQQEKYESKLENLLQSLSEKYNISFERACNEFYLDIPIDEARKKVIELRKKIFSFGEVNTGAVSEYKRLKERYLFLNNQKNDLVVSCNDLKNMISEMDEIMEEKFKDTYEKVNKEFDKVFKTLFKGGSGKLKLTVPEDLLLTGVDIIAEPPGKKLNSINLLSGGEKTLTAIALLFAILNVKSVPFCVFDEVEAALDERNVDTFGEYLKAKQSSSQFILITHKKKTMEFADSLYGITMQESGVSKIVSVKLED